MQREEEVEGLESHCPLPGHVPVNSFPSTKPHLLNVPLPPHSALIWRSSFHHRPLGTFVILAMLLSEEFVVVAYSFLMTLLLFPFSPFGLVRE